MKGRMRLSYLLIMYLVFIMVVGVFLTAGEAIEKTEEWVSQYDGPGNGPDFANAITVDSLGNVLVTGRCQVSVIDSDYGTIKYDTNSNEIWVKRYNGLGNNVDFANAITVDLLGNVYVTGESYGGQTAADYATIKYDPNGTQLWDETYDGVSIEGISAWDSANAIASDSLGNVYVTGRSGYDYATIKYDTIGTQLWAVRYDSTGSDSASAIAIDSSGNVLVTGGSKGDYATIKYDPNGNEIWVRLYNGLGNSTDEATDIAIDSADNVYVTGKSFGSGTNYDYATIKYDPNGNEIWVRPYNGLGNNVDEASAIAIDSAGNVFVTGKSLGSGTNSDYATIKYDTNGNEIWVRRYNGPGNNADEASAIAIDSAGNVFVTGESIGSGTNSDYATIKYDPNGIENWFARYNGPGNNVDEASAIAIDSAGNAFVTGKSFGSGTIYDYATLKYGGEGEIEVIMDLPMGWSMISIPVLPDNATLSNLFPEAVVLYKFLKTMGYVRIEEDDNLEVGMGYWILLNTPHLYTIRGTAIPEYKIPVENGWYMIGGCTSPAQKLIINGIYIVVYGFDQSMGYIRIEDDEPLESGNGYWILFSETSAGAVFTASTSF